MAAADGEGGRVKKRRRVKGSGGGGSQSNPVEAANTLQAKSLALIIDLIGEGPNVGLVNPATGEPGTGTEYQRGILYSDAPLENADGTKNFPGAVIYERIGDPDQAYIPDFPAGETPNIGVFPTQVVQATPVVRRITNPDVNRARVGIRVPALSLADTGTGDINGNRVTIKISVKAAATTPGSEYVDRVLDIIDGKCVAPYERAYGIELDGAAPWDIKVTRVSPDDASAAAQSQTFFQYLTEIVDTRINYADRHVVAQVIDAQQTGGQIPQRNFIIKGRIIKVPSNYDPVAHTYDGEWDGLFVDAWTNNPAWIVYDLLTNERYGLGADISEDDIEPWDFYTAGQYCDEMVDDGNGGTEPRFTFNGAISQQQDAVAVIQAVAGMFRSALIWGGEKFSLMTNKPKAVSKLFTRANVRNGKFSYSGTALGARHTVAIVDWINPELNYEPDVMPVQLPESVRRYGHNELKFTAVGCTSPGQAYRQGLAALLTEWLETDTVTFECGITDASITLGSVISIADPIFTSQRRGGRLLAVNSATSVQLDSAYVFDNARTYTLKIMLPNGDVGSYAVTNPGTSADTITIATLPAAPDRPTAGAVWALHDDQVEPRQFYVLGLAETDDHWVKVTALQYDPEKFDQIDNGVILPSTNSRYTDINIADVTAVDEDTLTLTYKTRNIGNGVVGQVVASWEPVIQQGIRGYQISYQYGYGPVIDLPEVKTPNYTFDNLQRTRLTVWVRAVNQFGYVSAGAVATIDLDTSSAAGKNLISALQVQGGGSNWSGRDINIEWNALPSTLNGSTASAVTTGFDQEFQNFRVRVYDTNGGTLLGTLTTTETKITITYDQLSAWAAMRRSYYVTVELRDVQGAYSAAAGATFTNPAPSLPTITVVQGPGTLKLVFTDPTDPDYIGIRVWASATNGFTPGAGNLVWEGAGNPLLNGTAGATVYYIFETYDAFGSTSLNRSTQQTGAYGNITATGATAGSIDSTALADNAVTTPKIADAAVTTAELASSAVSTAKIAAGAVTTTELGALAVTTAKIAAAAVTAVELGTAAVTSAKLAALAVLPSKLQQPDTQNLILDPMLADTSYWAAQNGCTIDTSTDVTTTMNLPRAFKTVPGDGGTGTTAYVVGAPTSSDYWVPLEANASYIMTAQSLAKTGFNGRVRLRVYWYKQDKVTAASTASSDINGTNYGSSPAGSDILQTLTGVLTPPADAIWARVTAHFTSSGSLARAGYAYVGNIRMMRAVTSGQVVDSAISTAKIADLGITTAKINTGAVTSNEIGAAAVVTAKIAASAVTSTELGTASVVTAKLASAAVTANELASLAVTTAKINTGAVTSTELGALAVTTAKINTGAVTSNELGAAAVITAKIAANAVTSTEIAALAVTTAKVAASAITVSELASAAVTTAKIAASAVTSTELGALAVTTAKINAGAVTATEIGAAAVTTAKINTGAVDTNALASLAVTGAKIAAATITASNIAAGTITANEIAAGTITAAKIAAGTITAAEIAVGAITASKLYVTDLSNMVLDTNFNDTTVWTLTNGWAFDTSTDVTTTLAAPKGVKMTATGANPQSTGNAIFGNSVRYISVEASKAYRLAIKTLVKTGFKGQLSLVVNWYDQAGTFISGATVATGTDYRSSAAGSDTTGSLDGQVTSLSTAAFLGFYVTCVWPAAAASAGSAFIAAPRVHRANSSELIVDGAITAAKIAANTITASQIAAGTITTAEIAANTIVAADIAAGTITTTEIAANTIVAADIAAGTITANEIAASTITAAKIATGTITANEIAASTITGAKIAAGTITATNILANTIVASKIAVTDTTNMVLDPNYNDSSYWNNLNGWTVGSTDATAIAALSVPQGAKTATGNGTTSQSTGYLTTVAANQIPVEPGKSLRLFAKTFVKSGFTGRLKIVAAWYKADGTTASTDATDWSVTGTDYRTSAAGSDTSSTLEGLKVVPSDAYYVRFQQVVDWSTTLSNAQYGFIAMPRMHRAVSAELVVDGTITAAKIAADTITASQISASAITSSELAANAVIAGKIAAGTIVAADIASDTITASQIASNAITSNELASNSVIAGKIAAGTIVAADIAADTITAGQIAAGAIASSELAANAVIAGKIAAGTIVAADIAALTITAAQIAAGTITANEIATSTITAAKIAAGAITASKLALTDSNNMLVDSDFLDSSYWTYSTSTGAAFGSTDTIITSNLGSKRGYKGPNGDGTTTSTFYTIQNTLSTCPILVEPSKSYRVFAKIAANNGCTMRGYLQINWYKQDGTSASTANSGVNGIDYRTTAAVGTQTGTAEGIVTAPSDAYYCTFIMVINTSTTQANAGNIFFAMPRMFRAASAEMIVDGTITAAKIAADAITASQIAASAITSSELAANAVIAGKIAAGTIVAADIAANTITAAKIAAGTITATEIAAGTITGAKIAASTITGSLIAADTITASKILVGDMSNVYRDPDMQDAAFYSLSSGTGGLSGTSLASGSTKRYISTAQTAAQTLTTGSSNVEPGKSYYFTASIGRDTATSGNPTMDLYLDWYSVDASNVETLLSSSTVASITATSNNHVQTGIFAAPSTARRVKVRVVKGATAGTSSLSLAGPVLRRAAAAELIVDGTITAGKIAAGAITANEIAANTITAAKIAAGTITATEIAASTITAAKMNVSSLSAISANLGSITAGTLALSASSYVVYHGAGFGVSSDLIMWFGASATAMGSATKTNGIFALATDGKVYFGSAEVTANATSAPVTSAVFTKTYTTASFSTSGTTATTLGTIDVSSVPSNGFLKVLNAALPTGSYTLSAGTDWYGDIIITEQLQSGGTEYTLHTIGVQITDTGGGFFDVIYSGGFSAFEIFPRDPVAQNVTGNSRYRMKLQRTSGTNNITSGPASVAPNFIIERTPN